MTESLVWADANGTEYALDGIVEPQVLWGPRGRFMPPIKMIEEEVPLQPGARLREVRALLREVEIPVLFEGTTDVALRSQVRSWLARLNPTRGDGRLIVIAPDGARRELVCRYAAGMEGEETPGAAGILFQKALWVFRAHDPYWTEPTDQVLSYSTGEASATFFPFFPLRLAGSEVFAEATVDNTGDVEAWPVWIITGPGSDPILRNLTTGKVLQFVGLTLAAGETLTIDTRPGHKSAVKNDASNLFGKLSPTSEMWALLFGPNSIQLELTGASEASTIQLTYRRRFLGA